MKRNRSPAELGDRIVFFIVIEMTKVSGRMWRKGVGKMNSKTWSNLKFILVFQLHLKQSVILLYIGISLV